MTKAEDTKTIEEQKGKYYVYFAELGSYDSIDCTVDTSKEANEILEKLQKKYPLYYGFIAKIEKVVRKSD